MSDSTHALGTSAERTAEPHHLKDLLVLLEEHIAPLVPDFSQLNINHQRAWGAKLREIRHSHPVPGFVEWADDILHDLEHFHFVGIHHKVSLFPDVVADLRR